MAVVIRFWGRTEMYCATVSNYHPESTCPHCGCGIRWSRVKQGHTPCSSAFYPWPAGITRSCDISDLEGDWHWFRVVEKANGARLNRCLDDGGRWHDSSRRPAELERFLQHLARRRARSALHAIYTHKTPQSRATLRRTKTEHISIGGYSN